jgi:hypothetical protein
VTCQLHRKDNKIEKVLAPNQQPSILYSDFLEFLKNQKLDDIIEQVPYLQERLSDGSIKGKTDPEIAVGLWSMAYTPEWEEQFSSFNDFRKQMTLDENGEPRFNIFRNIILSKELLPKNVSEILSEEKKADTKYQQSQANHVQQQIIDDLVLNPKNPVFLEPESHVYFDSEGNEYTSVTTAIEGKGEQLPQYEHTRQIGTAIDRILQAVIKGEEIPDVPALNEPLRKKFYDFFTALVEDLTKDGSVLLTQVALGDPKSGVAGSMDIVKISPEGRIKVIDLKTSKNSVKSNQAFTAYPVKEGSRIGGVLNRVQKQGIQVGVYTKLIQLQGYLDVEEPETYHILLKMGEEVEQLVQDFGTEGVIIHEISANEEFINKVISEEPTGGKDNNYQSRTFFSEEQVTADEPELPASQVEKLSVTLDDIEKIFKDRLGYFKSLAEDSANLIPRKETISKIHELLSDIAELRTQKGGLLAAYGRFIRYAQEETNIISAFINNPKNYDRPEYYHILDEVAKFNDSYLGIAKIRGLVTDDQKKMLEDLLDSLENLNDDITRQSWTYVTKKISDQNPDLTPKEIEDLMEAAQDIEFHEYVASDLAGSRDKLLGIIDTRVKKAMFTSKEAREGVQERIKQLGNRYAKLAGKLNKDSFNFMYELDAKGNPTRLLQKISQDYWKLRDEVYSALRTDDGKLMEYIQITDIHTADPKDLEYNRKLYKIKERVRKFTEAESTNGETYEDGEYHKYTQEYKDARGKVEEFINGRWIKRPDVTEAEHTSFRRKYQEYVEYWEMAKDWTTKEPIGIVTRRTGWFPNRDHIEIREFSAKGKDMRNKRYVDLQGQTSELGKLQKEIYNAYMDIIGGYTNRMGPSAQRWLKKGSLMTLQSNFTQQARNEGLWTVVKRGITNSFTPTTFSSTRVTDEAGNARQVIPKLYMGDLRNQKKVENLQKKIQELAEQKAQGKISQKEYRAERKKLNEQLRLENTKPLNSELETDVFKQMLAFSDMAENFLHLSAVEGEIMALKDAVINRKYYQKTATGKVITKAGSDEPAYIYDPKNKNTKLPNTVKRLNAYLSMVFYNDKTMTHSQMEIIAKRIQNITSLRGVGLNIKGNLNNYTMGRLNNLLEMAANKYFSRKSYFRAEGVFNAELLPGFAKKLGSSKEGPYANRKPGSKAEALIDSFHMITKWQEDQGRVSFMDKVYLGQEIGEYNVQGKVGLAVLMSRQIKNKKTGESVSIYDAYEFNPNTGELKLKDGFELSSDEKFNATNYIKEVNKHIHGNYAWEDRVMLQQYTVGQLLLQFHKHIYPALRARFIGGYDHATLGEYEGRYVTAVKFFSALRDFDGYWSRVTSAWGSMSDIQKKNLMQDLSEILLIISLLGIYSLISNLAKGIPDDEYRIKRLVHFLSFQTDRLRTEVITFNPVLGVKQMYEYVKNPVAISNTLKNFSEAIMSTVEYPFQSEEDAIYQKGAYKDQSKMSKEWRDVLPLIHNYNDWLNLDTETKFHIF